MGSHQPVSLASCQSSSSLVADHGRRYVCDITADSPINGKVPNLPGRTLKGAMRFVDSNNRRQTPTDKNNWGPRFGFVYAINNATVFRGSYGIIYSPSVLQAAGTSGSSGTAAFQSSTGVSRSFDGDVTAFARLDNPFPNGFNRPQGIAGGAATQLGLGISDVFFIDNANPIIQEWSATLQRNLGKSSLWKRVISPTKATT